MEGQEIFAFSFSIKDWLIIGATFLGPIFAVQAQKFIELARERRNRKHHLFSQLMATRALRLSPDHVVALNMIDIVFNGSGLFNKRTSGEQKILDDWKVYLNHLETNTDRFSDDQLSVWIDRGTDYFTDLLFSISNELGYKFDKVHLRKNIYAPRGHFDLEVQNNDLRRNALSVLEGKNPLQVNIVSVNEKQ